MTTEQYFVEQAKFNKWLFELTPEEAKHILWMLNDFAEAKAKEAVNELVKTLESIKTSAEGVHTPKEAAAVLHFIRNKSFKALSETYKQSK
jgi:hypothetical protein